MFSDTSQFEPLMPSEQQCLPALEQARRLTRLSLQVSGRAHPSVMASVTPLLRKMNSYYTNLIEGQHTLPSELDQALKRQFSGDLKTQRKQRLAIAHIDTEVWAEKTYSPLGDWRMLLKAEAISGLHRALFSRLPPQDLANDDLNISPGALRDREVKVGRHIPPTAASVPSFLQRFESYYSGVRNGELALVAVAAMHHRLAWVHPFTDGNGRVARLHSHLLLHQMGALNGAWSPLRGLARSQSNYYSALANADAPRRGDLDGRGNLSQQSLLQFIEYLLDVCIDQASFMSTMLDSSTMKDRIAACLAYESHKANSNIKLEALLPMHYLFTTGSLQRGQFKQMTGLAVRSSERCLKDLLDRELLVSDSPKGELRFGIPLHALRFYFPALWPEAEAGAS